tara:strand:+ start:317 stop:619 length:303 start_codon:yes stop_codon:yes gene_type:complete
MSRYRGIDRLNDEDGTVYVSNAIYPSIPKSEDDIYVIGSVGDRYDTLAQQFYQDASLWWIIASSNNEQHASLNVTPGKQIRIPADKNQALRLFEEVNRTR